MNDTLAAKQFGRLLVFLLSYLFLTPFIPLNSTTTIVIQALLSVMLFFAANAVQKKQNQRRVALAVMGVALVVHWLGVFNLVPYSTESALLLFVLFYALLVYSFVRQLVRATRVSGGVIMATLCLYLVIGLLWGAGYALLDTFYDGAFSGALLENVQTSKLHLFNYFSIVTLTTLGYGDITPQIPEAASLCQMEAIIGQFFTAVLVAWLVGMYGKPMGNDQQS